MHPENVEILMTKWNEFADLLMTPVAVWKPWYSRERKP